MTIYISRTERRAVMERDGNACRYCGRAVLLRWPIRGRPGRADDLTLDHVVPLARGGSSKRDNLVVACRACNAAKGSDLHTARQLVLGTTNAEEIA